MRKPTARSCCGGGTPLNGLWSVGGGRQRGGVARGRRQERAVAGQAGHAFLHRGGLIAETVEHRAARRFLCRDDGEGERCHDKGGRENPCDLAQGRGCGPAGHGPAATAAHAEPAALGALQQHHADQRERQKQVDGQDDVFHGSQGLSLDRGLRGIYAIPLPPATRQCGRLSRRGVQPSPLPAAASFAALNFLSLSIRSARALILARRTRTAVRNASSAVCEVAPSTFWISETRSSSPVASIALITSRASSSARSSVTPM